MLQSPLLFEPLFCLENSAKPLLHGLHRISDFFWGCTVTNYLSWCALLLKKSCPSLEIRALTLGCSSLSFSCSISCYLLLKCFTHSSPSSSLGNRATPRTLSWIMCPNEVSCTFIYPIRVILMTLHLQWTRLDLGQEIYGWDLISHSLKSPKWTLQQIFPFEKSYYPKYLKVHFMT